MNNEVDSLQTRLRLVDDQERKGLLRAAEAESQRQALLRRMMRLVVPDSPLPRLPWRVHLGAVLAMALLVGSVSAYLLSGDAGLRRRSEEMLAAGRQAAAQDEQARRHQIERVKAGAPLAPDETGRFAPERAVAGPRRDTAAAAPVAPLLSGRVMLAPALASRVAPEDALFIVVRLPDDPDGLPLATIRVEAINLPFDFDIGTRELLGAPERFLQAKDVVVSARVSRSGSGAVHKGDLIGTSASVAPWSTQVAVNIAAVADPGRDGRP